MLPAVTSTPETPQEDARIVRSRSSVEERPSRSRSSSASSNISSSCFDTMALKEVRQLDGYHGFLPRDEVNPLLKCYGDYLIRVTETEEEANGQKTWEIIVSSRAEKMPEKPGPEEEVSFVNVVVERKQGKYSLKKKQYNTIKELIDVYKDKPCNMASSRFILKNPIGLQNWEYRHTDVRLVGKELGKGAFGVVQLGELLTKKGKKKPVAIKSTKGAVDLPKEMIKKLMEEARIPRDLRSPYIVKSYGVAVDEQPLYILFEMVDGGALDKFLKKNHKSLSGDDRLCIALGAARGLAYLHGNNKIHCDVASRNYLVTTLRIVKLTDFGLTIDLKPEEVKCRESEGLKLPVKWLAPETLERVEYSHKTDVYSYGVFCSEVFTGTEPYQSLNKEEAKKMIANGQPPAVPKPCPQSLQDFLSQRVFSREPKKRPRMEEVIVALTNAGAKDAELPKKKK